MLRTRRRSRGAEVLKKGHTASTAVSSLGRSPSKYAGGERVAALLRLGCTVAYAAPLCGLCQHLVPEAVLPKDALS